MTTRFEKVLHVAALVLAFLMLLTPPTRGEQAHQHPERDRELHDGFYKDWTRPDWPRSSCCSYDDCYPSPVKRVAGVWMALKRDYRGGTDYDLRDPSVAENWHPIPDDKLEHNLLPGTKHPRTNETMREPRQSPDGRNHVCMKNTNEAGEPETWFVYCAVLGDAM